MSSSFKDILATWLARLSMFTPPIKPVSDILNRRTVGDKRREQAFVDNFPLTPTLSRQWGEGPS